MKTKGGIDNYIRKGGREEQSDYEQRTELHCEEPSSTAKKGVKLG
jgi:hypothetical protein